VRLTFEALPQPVLVETTNTASVVGSLDEAGGTLPTVRAAAAVTILPRLADLPDLAPARQRRLRQAGVRTVPALAAASPERIAAIVGVDAETAAGLIKRAKEALSEGAEEKPAKGRRPT
jgi:hypothetical protein